MTSMMGRERNGLLACLFALLCAFALPQPQAEAAGRVEAVAAHVTASEGLPPLVQQRMERSVQVIAEQLLLGMPADSSAADAAAQSEVIRQVFDKVLVGYTVRDVSLQLGDTAEVTVELSPWADQIRTISVETHVEGMPPVDWTKLKKDALVYDIIYTPERTRFLSEAQAHGHAIINGEGMLAGQGAVAAFTAVATAVGS